jgi:RNA polymerase sigma-70 factor (sigma-E family)
MMAGMAGAGDEATVDRPAFVALFEEHYASLVRLARLLVDDHGSGEEVVQDAFVRMYRRWSRIDDPVRYLRTAVVNGARSRLRHRAVVRRYVAPTTRPVAPVEDEVVVLSEHAAVANAVRALPRRQRECLVLRYYADLSEAEIATTLGISRGSVKSHASRGIAALGRLLEDDA